MAHTPDSSSDNFAEITPNDDADLSWPPRYLIVETSGDLVVHNRAGVSVTVPVQAGHVALRPRRVLETSSVGTIIGCW
jgi:hypothetical protein